MSTPVLTMTAALILSMISAPILSMLSYNPEQYISKVFSMTVAEMQQLKP